jgi:hypothetical protein
MEIAYIVMVFQVGLQQAENLSVQVIDRRGEEEQSTDRPSVLSELFVDLIQVRHGAGISDCRYGSQR